MIVLREWRSRDDENLYRLCLDRGQLFIQINDEFLIGPVRCIEDFDSTINEVSKKYPDLSRFLCLLRLSKLCKPYLYKPEIVFSIRIYGCEVKIRRDHSCYTLIVNNVLGPSANSIYDLLEKVKKDLILRKLYPRLREEIKARMVILNA